MPPKADLRRGNNPLLDLCFVIDATGSMWPYIEEAADKIVEMANKIKKDAKLEDNALRVAVVAFRDVGEEFVTKTVIEFTSNISTVQSELGKLRAVGGGDGPEAVASGLSHAFNIVWSPEARARKMIILITDAPPHGIETNDKAKDNKDILQIWRSIPNKTSIFVLKCLPTMREEYDNAELFYESILTKSSKNPSLRNGTALALMDAALLSTAVVGLMLQTNTLINIANSLYQQVKALPPASGRIVLPPLHDQLLLIANSGDVSTSDVSNNDVVNRWMNASSVNDVVSATDNHAAKVDEAKGQVKKLLAGTEFVSIKTNVFEGPLAPEEEHNVKIWANARSVDEIRGLKTYNRPDIDVDQTLHYEHGPIDDHQIMRLASIYADAHAEE